MCYSLWLIFHCIYVRIFFICSSADGHPDCFHVLAIVNSTSVNIGLHVPFWSLAFSVYMPSSGIARSYGSSIPSFLRNLHTVLHSGYINLRSYQQCKRASFPQYPLQHLLFVDFFNHGHFDGARWYLIVVLICIVVHWFLNEYFLKKVKIQYSVQFSSVAQSCLTLCDPMDCSTPDFSVHPFKGTHFNC